MKRYRLKKVLYPDAVRTMCINNCLYTKGDNQAYSFMLEMCEEKCMTSSNIYRIAEDILEHSDTDLSLDDIALMLMQRVVLVIQ